MTESTSALQVVAVSLDCADHRELAGFYVRLLEGTLLWTHEKAAAIESGGVVLVMQRIEDYQPPVWPGASIVHLDLHGGAPLEQLERRAIALGAQSAQTQPDSRWRVLFDPAGHPFCITPFTP
ncbi:MAG: VOC family protein [Streptosporangiales bacterium]